jgi:RES domain-containing protein
VGRPDPDRIIAERLADLKPHAWSGEVWRHTFAASPPERRNVRGARWNPPNVEALYVSLAAETALAEAEYLIESQPLRPTAKRTLHRLRISLTAVVDLTDRDVLLSLGVGEKELESEDLSACQAVGAAAVFLRLDGIIVPSARNPGDNIVILFAGADAAPEIEVLESVTV